MTALKAAMWEPKAEREPHLTSTESHSSQSIVHEPLEASRLEALGKVFNRSLPSSFSSSLVKSLPVV